MSKFLAAVGLSSALAAATALPLATQAEAAMSYGGQSVADLQHQIAPVEKAQFFFWSGYNWCWYPFGWHGPGWYWCDYEWDNGYGWGGPYGWNGWYIAPYYRSGNGWQWWHRHHHVPKGGPWHGHPWKSMTGPPNTTYAPMMRAPTHYRTPLVGAPAHYQTPWVGAPAHYRTPMMMAPAHNFAPMMGNHMPTGGHPNGGRLCGRPPC
ncbi:MAG: hypothetical protein ABSF67_04625 [Roseiarcus sp.]|jgi:hypothetical protein